MYCHSPLLSYRCLSTSIGDNRVLRGFCITALNPNQSKRVKQSAGNPCITNNPMIQSKFSINIQLGCQPLTNARKRTQANSRLDLVVLHDWLKKNNPFDLIGCLIIICKFFFLTVNLNLLTAPLPSGNGDPVNS